MCAAPAASQIFQNFSKLTGSRILASASAHRPQSRRGAAYPAARHKKHPREGKQTMPASKAKLLL
ncbi:peptidase S10, partial [Pseudomonas sp. MWU12-2534b]